MRKWVSAVGARLSSTRLATFSFAGNLTSNWGISGPEEFEHFGAFAVVAASVNTGIAGSGPLSNGQGCTSTQSAACNGGCDPSNTPGYLVTTTNNLLGSVTHNQGVFPDSEGLTEVSLFDDAAGDPTNLIYLQNQCGALVGNGTGGGICNCPIENSHDSQLLNFRYNAKSVLRGAFGVSG